MTRRGNRTGGEALRRSVPIALLVVLAALGLGTLRAVLASVGNLNLDRPLVAPASPPVASAATPPRRVLVVVVDGLRADLAGELPFLAHLRAEGAAAELWAEPPTYSSAQYVALLTGVPPRDSGVRSNVGLRRTPLDSVPARVRAHGRRTIQIGDEVAWWETLFGDDWARARVVAPGALLAEAAAELGGADLALVHLTLVDQAGHRDGARAPSYRAAAFDSDAKIATLARAWGWPRAPIVVLSDHGHVPYGGHGGAEEDVRRSWLLASGPGIRPGARVGGASAIDVAPTLGALVGVPAPAQAQGRTLVALLDVDAAQARALREDDAARVSRLAGPLAAARARAAAEERRGRLLRLGALALCLALAGFCVARGGRPARRGLVVGGAALALTAVAYAARYGRVSFSADRDASTLAETTILLAGLACLAAFALPAWRAITFRLSTADACALAFGAVAAGSPLAAVAFVHAGAFTARVTCSPAWVAAGPLVAYCAFFPVVFAATGLISLAVTADVVRPSLLAAARRLARLRRSLRRAAATGARATRPAKAGAGER